MRNAFIASVISLAIMTLMGCASVIRGTSELVNFDSDPPGAEMRSVIKYPCGGPCPQRDNRESVGAAYPDENTRTPTLPGPACVTPCSATVPRNQDFIVTFSKAGYESQTVPLEAKNVGGGVAVAGNIIAGGVVGAVVDAGNGAGLDHQPNPLKVTLRPVAASAPVARQQKKLAPKR